MAVRPATPEEAKTALQRERDLAAELRRQLDAREHRIDSPQAEFRVLAAGNPAVLPVARVGLSLDAIQVQRVECPPQQGAGGSCPTGQIPELDTTVMA